MGARPSLGQKALWRREHTRFYTGSERMERASPREAFLMVFKKENADAVILASGRLIKNRKVFEASGEEAKCSMCSKALTVERVGRILPGSTKLCCDDPTCFNEFSVELM